MRGSDFVEYFRCCSHFVECTCRCIYCVAYSEFAWADFVRPVSVNEGPGLLIWQNTRSWSGLFRTHVCCVINEDSSLSLSLSLTFSPFYSLSLSISRSLSFVFCLLFIHSRSYSLPTIFSHLLFRFYSYSTAHTVAFSLSLALSLSPPLSESISLSLSSSLSFSASLLVLRVGKHWHSHSHLTLVVDEIVIKSLWSSPSLPPSLPPSLLNGFHPFLFSPLPPSLRPEQKTVTFYIVDSDTLILQK